MKIKIIAGLLALSFCLPVFAAYDGTRQVKAVVNGKKKVIKCRLIRQYIGRFSICLNSIAGTMGTPQTQACLPAIIL